FTTTLERASRDVVSTIRRVGKSYWAIVAGPDTARTLAAWRGDRWTPIRHPRAAVPATAHTPRELWLRGPSGAVHQAFYVGPPAPEKVVVWWHGGPRENVSPRFHPYFWKLQTLGFGVLAVNYPGSTGRGRAWELAFGPTALADCVAAVRTFLADNG